MNLLQLLGLKCRHPYLSYPFNGARVCNECGERFLVDHTIESWERGDVVHYRLVTNTITRLGDQILRFRKRGLR